MSVLKPSTIGGFSFNTEISNSQVPIATTSSSLGSDGVTLTVTTATAHGLLAGQHVTFSGATPSTYNGTFFQILAVPTTTTFTIYTTLGAATFSSGTTIRGLFLTNGFYYVTFGANASFQYNPDNTGYPNTSGDNPTRTGAVWRTPTNPGTCLYFDGFGMAILLGGSAGTTLISKVK
jgi:hypothetical protein